MTASMILDVATTISLWLLGVAIALTLIRLVRGPTLADRVLALDLLNTLAMAVLAAFAVHSALWLYLDLAIALALLGFLSTVAFARYIARRANPAAPDGARP